MQGLRVDDAEGAFLRTRGRCSALPRLPCAAGAEEMVRLPPRARDGEEDGAARDRRVRVDGHVRRLDGDALRLPELRARHALPELNLSRREGGQRVATRPVRRLLL